MISCCQYRTGEGAPKKKPGAVARALPLLGSNQDSLDPESVPRGQRSRPSCPETVTYRASCPLPCPKMPASARRNGSRNGSSGCRSVRRWAESAHTAVDASGPPRCSSEVRRAGQGSATRVGSWRTPAFSAPAAGGAREIPPRGVSSCASAILTSRRSGTRSVTCEVRSPCGAVTLYPSAAVLSGQSRRRGQGYRLPPPPRAGLRTLGRSWPTPERLVRAPQGVPTGCTIRRS